MEKAFTQLESHDLHAVQAGCIALSATATRALRATPPPAAVFAFHWALSMADFQAGGNLCLKAFRASTSTTPAIANSAPGMLTAATKSISAGSVQLADATRSI